MMEHTLFFRSEFGALSVLSIVFSFIFDVFVIVIIIRRVYVRERPTAETIFGALCVYLLIGFTFARLYAIIATVHPGALYLDPATNHHSVAAGFDFIFFSFGTMTSLGASGIVAVSAQVRSLSVTESILGVLYLAVFISRLMDAYR
jgi:glucan phosphoethanolaminetransferase (alkaline phosphatase superfamily)